MVDTPMAWQAGSGLTRFFPREDMARVARIALSIPPTDCVAATAPLFPFNQFRRERFDIREAVDRGPGASMLSGVKLLDLVGMAFFADPAHEHADPKGVIIRVVIGTMAVDACNTRHSHSTLLPG
jgi:hypothetical protein